MHDALLKVILVEDDDVAAEAVIRNMHKLKVACRIVLAENGEVALEMLRKEHTRRGVRKPTVTLLDLNMPRMNGFEFLHEVRRDKAICDAVVFVLTTSDSEADRDRAYQAGVAGYMVKSKVGPHFVRVARLLTDYHAAVQPA